MPTVKKQVPQKKVANEKREGRAGITSRIMPVSKIDKGIKLLIYGHGKTGKTRLACTFPKPLLLIGAAGFGTEKGTRSVSTVKGIDFIGLEVSEEIEELVKLRNYESFVLDTAGGLQERVVNEFTEHDPQVRKDWRHVSRGDWGPINSRTMERLRCLLDAADNQGKSTIIVAHERAFNVEVENNDLLFPHVGAALTPGVSGWLDGAVDYIGQCYIREETKQQSISKTLKVAVGTGRMQYCLRVGPHPVYRTGFRVPVGVKIPDTIANPSYHKINELIG